MYRLTTKRADRIKTRRASAKRRIICIKHGHNQQRHRRTDRQHYDANTCSYCVEYDRLKTETSNSYFTYKISQDLPTNRCPIVLLRMRRPPL